MDLRQLRYFVAVAEAGHVTRAARRLGMQQPPLSQQIRALEAQFGVTLFKRHAKGVTLTPAGEGFLTDARRILERVAAAEQRMGRVAAGLGGLLTVGFTSSAAAHAFTPQVLRDCRQRFPDIELRLSEDNAAGLIDGLVSHRLDCAFLRVPVARPGGVEFEVLMSEPAVLAMPINHALALRYREGRVVPLSALEHEALILVRRPGAPGLYANLLSLLADRGVAVRVVAEVDRMMTNINLVASGLGLSVVPASMAGTHAHSVAYRPLPRDARLEAPMTLCWSSDNQNPALGTFMALARARAKDAASKRKR